MKAENFMIGDYLNTSFGIAKIISIDKAGFTFENKEGEFDIDFNNDEDIWMQEIPLTSEILEKNGFKNTSVIIVGTPKMRWVSEDGRTKITIWIDDTTPMEISKNAYYEDEDEESYLLPFPGCVHELQHALRLCGIEKEIQL